MYASVLYPIVFSLPVSDLLTVSLEIHNFRICFKFRWNCPDNNNPQWFNPLFHFLESLAEFLSGCPGFDSAISAARYCASFRYAIKRPVITVLRRYVHVSELPLIPFILR